MFKQAAHSVKIDQFFSNSYFTWNPILVITAVFENLKSTKVISRKIRVAAKFWISQNVIWQFEHLGNFIATQILREIRHFVKPFWWNHNLQKKWNGILWISQFWKYSHKQISENILSRQSWISFPIWSLSKNLFFFFFFKQILHASYTWLYPKQF